MSPVPLPPGSVIGILGGGQLGRMLASAAARLGFDAHIYAPEDDCPAARAAAAWTQADFDDAAALARFAAAADVVTYEFENVPAACVRTIEAAGGIVRPGVAALEAAQDRVAEKRFLNACGIETAAFAPIASAADIAGALESLGAPALLKTRRMGYDGKGQAWIRAPQDIDAAWRAIGAQPAILEAAAPFVAELSIIAARGADGAVACYPLSRNVHVDGVLSTAAAPAEAPPAAQLAAEAAARTLLARLDYVGVLAIEFFLMGDGRLLANEIAPRVHNSGHWTPEACPVGQFEQHIRAVAGWPLGASGLAVARARMRNLIGADAADWASIAKDPEARITLYGKREARPGRKMGHVVWVEA